jgi:hypothetical protein
MLHFSDQYIQLSQSKEYRSDGGRPIYIAETHKASTSNRF